MAKVLYILSALGGRFDAHAGLWQPRALRLEPANENGAARPGGSRLPAIFFMN